MTSEASMQSAAGGRQNDAISASPRQGQSGGRAKITLRVIALAYLGFLLVGPVAIMLWTTFAGGLAPVMEALTRPAFLHALKLTLIITAIAVPLNTIFGIIFALLIVRREFRGKQILTALLDLPLAVSPVVVGLALIIVYGRRGEFGGWLAEHGMRVIFAMPGMVLATIFVSIPFVAREVIPVLREIGTEQEQAARTLGAIRLADLPHGHPPRHPRRRRLRRGADHGAGAGRVRGGGDRLRQALRAHRDADDPRRGTIPQLRHDGGLHRLAGAGAAGLADACSSCSG